MTQQLLACAATPFLVAWARRELSVYRANQRAKENV